MNKVLDAIRIVLVNTSHPGNVGAAARAMKNMGLTQLVLVAPREYPSPKALWRAANAKDILENARVVDTVADAVADCGLVIGTSARERRIPWPLLNPRECGERSIVEADQHPVAILFGREDRGLTNEELQQCHFHLHIPANPDYSALNLGAAVQVICYELRIAMLAQQQSGSSSIREWDVAPAKHSDLELYYQHLQETLAKLGFLDMDNPRQTLTRLRRLYNRIRPDEMELSILRGILTATQNYIYHSAQKTKHDDKSESAS